MEAKMKKGGAPSLKRMKEDKMMMMTQVGK